MRSTVKQGHCGHWCADYILGLENERYTGKATIELHFNQGGITRRIIMKEVKGPLPNEGRTA